MTLRIISFTVLISFLTMNIGLGQTKNTKSRKKTREKVEKVSIWTKVNPEIKFGNLGFNNGLYVSSKLNAGYKFSERFSGGLGTKLWYSQISVPGDDYSFFDFGGFLYARGKIVESVFLQAEYSSTNFAETGFLPKKTITYPTVGIGYYSNSGRMWRFGAELFYIFDSLAQDYQNSPVEYWFGATYNF
ncbi:MAG: hypothetical protein R2774_15760 [Saprospiraceae bacterium]